MFKRLFVALAAVAIVAGAPKAHAQAALLISGGLNAPVGRLSDITDIGYIVSGGINIGGTSAPVGTRLEGSFSDLGYKGGGEDIRLVSGTANAIFNLGTTRDAPYL
ncbi:MAG: hypothetical protein M3Z05_13480, partial [Gemmatimonadota bacterium]|nr:hypothetical protein [Gemmatimonadota bacterium]